MFLKANQYERKMIMKTKRNKTGEFNRTKRYRQKINDSEQIKNFTHFLHCYHDSAFS